MANGTQVIWSAKALHLLSDAAIFLSDFIGQQKANAFQIDLINHFDNLLSQFPEGCPPCRFPKFKKATCRCCVYKKEYILIYRIEGNAIKIIGVISARQNPKVFEDLV